MGLREQFTFRLVEGDLCILKRDHVPPVDDNIPCPTPVPMNEREARELPTWPRERTRVMRR